MAWKLETKLDASSSLTTKIKHTNEKYGVLRYNVTYTV